MKETILQYLGVEHYRVGHTEKLVSGLGAFLGILLVFYSSSFFVDGASLYVIVASMGASAVLLFAVPHGPLSQPWSLIGGHLISAIIGVSCAKFIPEVLIAAPLAVGLSVSAMYYFHCIHPPGGATALSAVVGGSAIHELGYQFVLTPVLINVIAILSVAIVFNYFFKWRRYPAYLAQKTASANRGKTESSYGAITHEDFVFALSEFESFIDISENDLLKIYDLVTQRHQSANIQHHELQHGHYYSNGEYGDLWSVRQIVDWANTENLSGKRPSEITGEEKLIYKVSAGADRRNSGVMSKNEFSRWAKHEVIRDEDNWRRVDETNTE
ncbi:MAG: HPP family protein [Proteobacteria bacterium]|nr:HPP family protein [Pseudomonadota bacterium]